MEIKFLGNKNERGKSFELLMASVLTELGYTKTRQNIRPAAMELDIQAVHKTNGNKILCEYKAHEQSIKPEDVKVFYGKLNYEIHKGNANEGFFFSTSGFTPNTHRWYDDSGEVTKKTLTLYDTDKIIQLFQQAKLLVAHEIIEKVIRKNTSYGIGERYLVVYQATLYFVQLLTLGDDVTSFIILKGTGNIVPIPIMDEISKLDTTLETLTRLDLMITKKVTLNLLDLKQKTANDVSKEIQETVDDIKIALGDLQLRKVVQSHEESYTINVDIPSLTILTERFASDESKFKFMSSAYIESAINDKFVDHVIGKFYLPVIDHIRETLKTSAKIFPSFLRFLLLAENTTYHHFYNTKQKFMSRPDAQQFDNMIISIFFKTVYEEIINDLRDTPPSYLKQKQIHGYSNAFDLKFGSQFDLILRIAGKMHTYITDKEAGEIKAGEILSPVDVSSNLALGNHLLSIEEYDSAIETYDIIIENSHDKELLWMAWNNKSQCFRMMRQHDNELQCIEESLKYKLSREALSNKILCLEALKKPIEEIESVKAQLNEFQ